MATNNVQPSYGAQRERFVEGGWVDMKNYDSKTMLCQTSAGIPFGRAVSRGTGEKGAVIGGPLADFIGITLRDITLIPMEGQAVDRYHLTNNMGVAVLGGVAVKCVGGAQPGDPVYYNSTTGEFGSAAGTGLVGPVPGAQWDTVTADGALGCVRQGINR